MKVHLVVPVRSCAMSAAHTWHVCKPGGSATWVCPGVGANALVFEEPKYGRSAPDRVLYPGPENEAQVSDHKRRLIERDRAVYEARRKAYGG